MFGIGEGMKSCFDFVARRSCVILRPGRQIGGGDRLKSTQHDDGNENRAA